MGRKVTIILPSSEFLNCVMHARTGEFDFELFAGRVRPGYNASERMAMTGLRKILFVNGLIISLGLPLAAPLKAQPAQPSAPPRAQSTPDEVLIRIQNLQKQVESQEEQIEKHLDLQREAANKQMEAASRSAGFWSVAPTLVWALFLGIVLVAYHRELQQILGIVLARLRQGGSVKVGSLEIGAVIALPGRLKSDKAEDSRMARCDDGRRELERKTYYDQARRVMLVHKLFPPTEEVRFTTS